MSMELIQTDSGLTPAIFYKVPSFVYVDRGGERVDWMIQGHGNTGSNNAPSPNHGTKRFTVPVTTYNMIGWFIYTTVEATSIIGTNAVSKFLNGFSKTLTPSDVYLMNDDYWSVKLTPGSSGLYYDLYVDWQTPINLKAYPMSFTILLTADTGNQLTEFRYR